MFNRTREEDKARRFYEEHKEILLRLLAEEFIEQTDWKDVDRFIAYFIAHDISHRRIRRKGDIEFFSQDNLTTLSRGDRYFAKIGDADFVIAPRSEDQVGGEAALSAYRSAKEKGVDIRLMVDEKALKSGQPRRNFRALVDLGLDVRYIDKNLHAIFVSKGEERSTCVWEGLVEDSHVRRDGYPQDPTKVLYNGYIIQAEYPASHVFVGSLQQYISSLWEVSESVVPVLEEVERKMEEREYNNGTVSNL